MRRATWGDVRVTRRWLLATGALAAAAAGVGPSATGRDGQPGGLARTGLLPPGPQEVDGPPPAVQAVGTRILTRMIGGGDTAADTGGRFDVYGADLGHMFTHRGRIYLGFGDTFGPASALPFVAHATEWRSNSLAWLAPTARPGQGLSLAGFVTDRAGHATELLHSQKNHREISVIPTAGISLGDRMLWHYMSVHRDLSANQWSLNYSGLAYSDDHGTHWIRDRHMVWRGDTPFGQAALVGADPYLYLFGTPGGRHGPVHLARAPATAVFDPGAYRYFDGHHWRPDPHAATPIVPAPAGELSVRWNSHYRAWLMTHQIIHPDNRLVLRTARHLTGPWSPPTTLATSTRWPGCYAPYLTPAWNDGPEIFYTISRYYPYAVYLTHTTLTETTGAHRADPHPHS